MDKELVELRVRGIVLDGPEAQPRVVLEDKARRRRVEFPAGAFEASAIIMELEGIAPPRPLAHDILAEVFQEGGFFLDEVVLSARGDEVRARLDYRQGLRRLAKEVGPADAVALAIRLGAPIEAEPALFAREGEALPSAGPATRARRKPRILLLEDWRTRAVGA